MQVVPLRLVAAVAVENLHPVVLAVGDIDPAVRVGDDVVRDVELARIGAALAPRKQQLAVRREFVDAGIRVAVRDIDVEIGRQRGVGAAVERLAAHKRRGPPRNADFEQYLAAERAFAHGVVAVIGAVQRLVRADMQPVRPVEQVFAPGIQQVAVAVEHHHRVLAAIEDIDPVLRVDRDRRDVLEAPALRQFRPVGLHPVCVSAVADDAARLARDRIAISVSLRARPPIGATVCPVSGAANTTVIARSSRDEAISSGRDSGHRRLLRSARNDADGGGDRDADDPDGSRWRERCIAPSMIICGRGTRRCRS